MRREGVDVRSVGGLELVAVWWSILVDASATGVAQGLDRLLEPDVEEPAAAVHPLQVPDVERNRRAEDAWFAALGIDPASFGQEAPHT